MTTLSVVINTCALGPRASNVTGSTTLTPHARRLHSLSEFIIPTLVHDQDIDELVITGEYEEGEGYTYVPSPSKFFSCVDALAQRQAGFEATSGDVVGFFHDDHWLAPGGAWYALHFWRYFKADVVVPERLQRRPHKALNNGMSSGYVGGHAAFYSREILEKAPWGAVPKEHVWDTLHTKMLLEADARIREVPQIKVYDVEPGVDE